jgi:hypothetical protein
MSYGLNFDNADTIEYTYLNGIKVSIKVIFGNTSYGIPLTTDNHRLPSNSRMD